MHNREKSSGSISSLETGRAAFPQSGVNSKKRQWWLLLVALSVLLLGVFVGLLLLHAFASPVHLSKRLAIPPASMIGVDYYHESMGYLGRTDEQIDSDLGLIQQVTNKIKVYHNPFARRNAFVTGDPLAIVESIVRKAKARGMYVVWAENDDTTILTDGIWSEYTRRVVADAAVAHRVGADEFLVGNELSLHVNRDPGYSDTSLPGRIKQLVRDCRVNFPGTLGYQEGWYKSELWHAVTLGPLDKIYFTLFEPWHNFKTAFDRIAADFGKKAEIGELAPMAAGRTLNYSEQDWTRELMRRYDYARQKGIAIWLFTFREPQDNGFGLFRSAPSSQHHDIWDYLTGHKTFVYDDLLSSSADGKTRQVLSNDASGPGNSLKAADFERRVIDVGTPDYVFRGAVIPLTTSGSETWRAVRLVFRYADADNYYFVNIEPNDGKIKLFRRQDGIETLLGETSTSLALRATYDFEIRVSGSESATRIQVFWNTVKVFALTDAGNRKLNSGGLGMKNNGVAGIIDAMVVTGLERVVSIP